MKGATMPDIDQVTGAPIRLKEGWRVYCDKQQFEGLILRDEDWGDPSVPVLVFDDTEEGTVMRLPVDQLTVI
jgi:hypothetical protein